MLSVRASEEDKALVFPVDPTDPIIEDAWTSGPGLTRQVRQLHVG